MSLNVLSDPVGVPIPDLLEKLDGERVVDLHWKVPRRSRSAYVLETLDPDWRGGPREAFALTHATQAMTPEALNRGTMRDRLGDFATKFIPGGCDSKGQVRFVVQTANEVTAAFEFWMRESFLGLRASSGFNSEGSLFIDGGTETVHNIGGMCVRFNPEELSLTLGDASLRVILPHRPMPIVSLDNIASTCRGEGFATRVPKWLGVNVHPNGTSVHVLSDDGQLVRVEAQRRPY